MESFKTTSIPPNTVITTCDMHTAGEPLRIITSGYPEIRGKTLLEKRNYAKTHLDHFRTFLLHEPRGHADMYAALLVEPDDPRAQIAVLFFHNEGYSTMCGHAVIALGRYAVDKGLVHSLTSPETELNIQCPCGLVKTYVEYNNGKSGKVHFHSVPAFVFKLDTEVQVEGFGIVKVDIAYGGAFYAFVSDEAIGLSVKKSSVSQLKKAATAVTDAVRKQVPLQHPDDPDLAFLYGTIVTDGRDKLLAYPTRNICVFADAQVDRSPTGSGITARIAIQYERGYISLHQDVLFESVIGTVFNGKAIRVTKCGQYNAVIVDVSGMAFYTGNNTFVVEESDPLQSGFLLRF